jgi:iron complex transport system substrate-binding protein
MAVALACVSATQARAAPRIAVLAPHLAEIAVAAGAGPQLVAVSSATDVPGLAELPVVATSGRLNLERLLRAKPDVVLAWRSGNPRPQIERLERLGVTVIATEVRTLDDIPRLVRLVGEVAGTSDTAEPKARALDDEIASIAAPASRVHPLVFVEIWHQPLLTVNGAHLISDIVRRCGGRNVFEAARTLTPVVSREALLKAAPDAVFINTLAGEQLARDAWSEWPVPAVRNRRLFAVDPRRLHDFGPGVIEAARQVCADLRGVIAATAP